jgi:hypothetical protein
MKRLVWVGAFWMPGLLRDRSLRTRARRYCWRPPARAAMVQRVPPDRCGARLRRSRSRSPELWRGGERPLHHAAFASSVLSVEPREHAEPAYLAIGSLRPCSIHLEPQTEMRSCGSNLNGRDHLRRPDRQARRAADRMRRERAGGPVPARSPHREIRAGRKAVHANG